MIAETSFDENAVQIKEELSAIDLDFGIGKLSASPVPYELSRVRVDESSVTMVTSDVSTADVLLSAFDSINIAKDTIKSDAASSICESVPPGQRSDEGIDITNFESPDFAGIAESSTDEDGEAEVVDSDHSLIVYTSSRRRNVRSTNTKLNQNNESPKPERYYRRIAKKKSVLDITSLQISRRKRSLFSNQARSSVWGLLGGTLAASEEHIGLDRNLSNEGLGAVRCGQGKRDAITDPEGRKSVRQSCTPAGHISLKIKIGNQIYGTVNATENNKVSQKSIPGLSDITESKFGEELPAHIILPNERNMEKVRSLDASLSSIHHDVRRTVENSSFSTSGDFHQTISHDEGNNLRASTEDRCLDAGTSPDSEVINSVPDAMLFEKGVQNMQDSPEMQMEKGTRECFANSVPDVQFGDISNLSLPRMKYKKGKKKDKDYQLGECSVGSKLTGGETTNNPKAPKELGPVQKAVDLSYYKDASTIATPKPHLNTYSSNRLSSGPSLSSRMTDSGTPSTTSKGYNGAEMNSSSEPVAATESSNSQASDTMIPHSSGQRFSKSPRAKGGCKTRPRILDVASKKDKSSKKKGGETNLVGSHLIDEKGDGVGGGLTRVDGHVAAGNQTSSGLGETGDLSKVLSGPINSLQFSLGELGGQYAPPRNAWVLCDECQKWRRIPATLADQIEETKCKWTCKDNTDKDFADCSIPQEKSNSEINEELEISDASCEEDAYDALVKSKRNQSKGAQPPSWSLIKSNLYLHRSRKTQNIDEVMVCHCKPPSDGRMGCGAKCLNRMLNIECVKRTCPCGELCSNQQFQKRKYAKLKWFRCGKKGFGLQAQDDISEGQFLIEYVGEVLDMHAYEARQREYALQGQKHFYFMTLNGSEVIDACVKGNLARFINHSCDPNCRTEKWMVNGEVCVGLFAVRDIKKGEEVTFDYNYVRVFGAAAKKCVCGSPNCRGYIGSDPTNSEVIVQGDSDDEYAEPVMISDDREMNDNWSEIMSNSLNDREYKSAKEAAENRYRKKKLVSAAGQLESITSETLVHNIGVKSAPTDGCFKTSTATQVVDMIVQDKYGRDGSVGNDFASEASAGKLDANRNTEESLNSSASAASKVESDCLQPLMHSSVPLLDVSFQSECISGRSMSSAPHFAHSSEMTSAALPSKSQPETIESKKKLEYGTLRGKEELEKSNSLAKTPRSSSSIKKGKLKSNVAIDKATPEVDKSNVAPHKSKKLPELSLNSHVEAVEEKLNELLDTEGGISKRKDASRGYLKLLFLTAAFGTNGHGEAIQSNRDLSMILDALLKTKSRTVLVDIINKNGLQMLHNILKRYRKEFIKTPILRKLLKVLEYLAIKKILTLEHITGGPPCPGVESFKDSILTLTEHADKQVHQTARNFRDRWIPRSFRKNCFIETEDRKIEFHPRPSYSSLSASSLDHWSNRGGKPAEVIECCATRTEAASGTAQTSIHSSMTVYNSGTNGARPRKRKSRWDDPAEEHLHPLIRTNLSDDGKPNIAKDIPPGFSAPCNGSMVPTDASSTALNCQERDASIKNPFDIVLGDSQQRFVASMSVSYGMPSVLMQQLGVIQSETAEGWTVAPGLPFHPFPPLPPYARGKGETPTLAAKCASSSEPAENSEQSNNTCVAHHSGQKRPICSVYPSEMDISLANDRPDFQQEGGSYSLGRKYFRQQRWNQSKLAPPWVRMRNGWGIAGNTRELV
ncbi:Histone-lysine N-methyltransferase [Handroanthus impetiginosus]|uniref:Histone-lysine N-methyltransferase n=1 Tax=Handroanthus impetiginosus TaxID=429701 RepID=A0A2G9H9C5_9LAMI|nr:Histone-lysine N-methyltransferase [Handroanthus impetiginosus]